jgi:putative endonuclease
MAHQRKKLGDWGESVAADFLEGKGYDVLHRQWRCAWGEMDLITSKDGALTFVEVKTRRGRGMGAPEQAITAQKASKLRRIALTYLGQNDLDVDWQIDMVAVELDRLDKIKRLEHIKNVVVAW